MSVSLKYKQRDNLLHGEKLRRRRNWLRSRLETTLGQRSTIYRNLITDVKSFTDQHRKKLRLKYKRKVEHLVSKFKVEMYDNVDMELKKKMGYPSIWEGPGKIIGEEVKDPVVVEGEGEKINLNEEELDAIKRIY